MEICNTIRRIPSFFIVMRGDVIVIAIVIVILWDGVVDLDSSIAIMLNLQDGVNRREFFWKKRNSDKSTIAEAVAQSWFMIHGDVVLVEMKNLDCRLSKFLN